jgi:serine phosphatase RsbU (regulator of sigma subunit)
MESATNSLGETIMMALMQTWQENKRKANAAAALAAAQNPDTWVTTQTMVATSKGPTEDSQFLADELIALRRDYAKLQQAVFEAAQIQRRLCAPRELVWGEFEIAGEIFPVRHLSGDFFKVMELPGVLGLALGDIAGKGFTAGIWQAHQMGLIRRASSRHSDPADIVAEVNRELCHDLGAPPLTALFVAIIDPRTNALRYCNAGLPSPLLLRNGNQSMEHLEVGGPILGAVKDATFEAGTVTLNPGDMLVAYSDGVTECRNAEDHEFEMNRLTAAIKAVSGVSASKALFSLLATVLDFAGSCSPGDDVTLLAVRRRDPAKTDQVRSRTKDFSAPQRRPASAPRSKPAGRGGRGSK